MNYRQIYARKAECERRIKMLDLFLKICYNE